MPRLLTLLCLFFLLSGCSKSPMLRGDSNTVSYTAPADAIVLRIEVLEVEFTDLYPGCGQVENCVPFHFWWKYRARVREVISGSWHQQEVTFTHLQHAEYISKVTKDCYVVLRPAGQEIRSQVGVPFVADKFLSRFFERDKAAIKALRDGT